jgi:hypothetical protein
LQSYSLDRGKLFDQLKPEFKAKYGINNYGHPYLRVMSRMLQVSIFIPFSFQMNIGEFCCLILVYFFVLFLKRKMAAVYSQNRAIWLSQLLSRLITLKPYIKVSFMIVIFSNRNECNLICFQLTDSWESAMERLEEHYEMPVNPMQCERAIAVNVSISILCTH